MLHMGGPLAFCRLKLKGFLASIVRGLKSIKRVKKTNIVTTCCVCLITPVRNPLQQQHPTMLQRSRVRIPLRSPDFFRCIYDNYLNCPSKCEDHCFQFISLICSSNIDLFHSMLHDVASVWPGLKGVCKRGNIIAHDGGNIVPRTTQT